MYIKKHKKGEIKMNEIIRKASIEDAYGISYVSAYSWTETYTGLVSDEYLAQKINNLSEKAKKILERDGCA